MLAKQIFLQLSSSDLIQKDFSISEDTHDLFLAIAHIALLKCC
jgi:hypothetical protein